MRSRGSIKQGRLVARRRRRLFYLCLYSLSAAGLLLSAFSYISGLEALSITDVAIAGNSRLDTSTIRSTVTNDLAGTYGYFFSRRNVLLYPRDLIMRDLGSMPLVKTVSVERSSMHTLAIKVTERQTTALWCDHASVGSRCYSVDEDGFIFALHSGADSGFIYKSDLGATSTDPIGLHVLPPADFKKVQFFMTELGKLAIDPREAELSASSTYMTVILGAGGKLVVNSADDLSTVLGNISAILADKTVVVSLDTFLKKLDYMKLDVGNKVVFKLR